MQLFLGYYHVNSNFSSSGEQLNRGGLDYIKAHLRRFRAGEEGVLGKIDLGNEVDRTPSIQSRNETSENAAIPPTKNPIEAVFRKAGIELTPQILDQIPPYSHVQTMYGEEPVIIGLERCDAFQQQVNPVDRMIGPAGYVSLASTH